jgi:Ser/Thr protein kinase RdoA (MazF antagonist)
MSEPFSLRRSLEAWEAEVAAHWDALIRSPDFLRRMGTQLDESLRSYQRITATLRQQFLHAATAQDNAARAIYLLERLEKRVDALLERVTRLEAALNDD